MEGTLLDLGVNTPASSGYQNQQQQSSPQQQQLNFDPFGVPQTAAQSPVQPTPPQQTSSGFDDAFGAAQPNTQQPVQQTKFDDAFGGFQQTTQPSPSGVPQNQQTDFDSIFTDSPKAPASPQQPLQPHELNFDVLVVSKPTLQENNVGGTSTSISASQSEQTVPAQEATKAAPVAKANGSAANSSSANTVAEQAITQPIPALDKNARLKEIKQLFGGRWRLLRSDPYAEYLKTAGVGILTRNRASSGTQELQISVLDEYIYVNTSSTLHSQINKFKLDEALENVVLKTNQSVFCTYNNKKLELQMTPLDVAWSKTQGVEYTINEREELMVIYTAGSHTCRRCYAKVYEVVG